MIAILVPADVTRRANLFEIWEGKPAMDTLTDSRGHWTVQTEPSEYASALTDFSGYSLPAFLLFQLIQMTFF